MPMYHMYHMYHAQAVKDAYTENFPTPTTQTTAPNILINIPILAVSCSNNAASISGSIYNRLLSQLSL